MFGIIYQCMLGALTCTYYPVNVNPPLDHSVVMVCPERIDQSPGRWAWSDTRMEITNRFGQRLVLQLGCPEGDGA